MVWPALIAGAASIGGNLLGMGASSANSAAQQRMYYDQMNLQEGARQQNLTAQYYFNEQSEKLQREFAQHGIRWKVADAVAAGIHPVFALGGAGATYSPTSFIPGSGPEVGIPSGNDPGQYLSNMGQDVSRAVLAAATREERTVQAKTALELENDQLQNDLLRAQIAKLNSQLGPPMPSGGAGPNAVSGNAGVHIMEPYEVPTSNPSATFSGAGPGAPSVEWRHNPDGSVTNYPAKGLNIDDITSPGWLNWQWQNTVRPFFERGHAEPPRSMLPKGAIGWIHHFNSWYPRYPSKDLTHLPKHPAEWYPY